MDGSISVSPSDRKALLKLVRYGDSVAMARHANVILLRSEGYTWVTVASGGVLRGMLVCFECLV